MIRSWIIVVAVGLFSVAALCGCSGPDQKKSSLVTETK